MAEVTAFRNNALPFPVYGLAYAVTFPLLDADGDPISPSSPDSERSLNGDTFADCTNEAVEIATSSGSCYLLLTAAEMTADIVTVQVKSTGAKTTVITLYPRKLAVLTSDTAQGANDTGDIQLASGESALNDFFNGCLIVATIDTVVEARIINDYVGSTKVAEISPAWVTAVPDATDTYVIYDTDMRTFRAAEVLGWVGVAPSALVSGRVDASVGAIAAAAITAASIAADAITDAKVASDVTIASVTGSVGSVTGLTAATVHADLDDIQARLPAALVGGRIDANVGAISSDATAADNAEAFFDGTGYAGTGNVIPTVTTVTGLTAATVHSDLDDIQARLPAALVSGRIDASVGAIAANTITAASIATGAIDADAIADGAIDAGAIAADAITAAKIADSAIDRATFAVDTGLRTTRSNTLAGAGTGDNTFEMDAGTSFASDELNGLLLYITGGAGVGQARTIITYNGVSKAGTVERDWVQAIDSTSTFALIPAARVDVGAVSGTVQTAGDIIDALTTIDNFLDTEVAAILAAVDTEVAAILALLDNARTEPGQGAPPVNPDMATKVDYLYKWARNKKDNNGTENKYYADDGTTVDHKQSTAESGGTVTVGEMATGA